MGSRGYFMTQQAEDEAKGRILLEYEEAKQAIARRREIARQWGSALEKIGQKLARRPTEVFFLGESVPEKLDRDPHFEAFDLRYLDAEGLKALRSEITELEERFAKLEKRKREIGFGE